MTIGVVNIINVGLTKLGATPIVSLDDRNNKNVAISNILWPVVRRFVISQGLPSTAIVREDLAADGDTPTFGYNYRYKLPSSSVRLLGINARGYAHQVEGRYIYTNAAAPLSVRYVKDLEDVSQFDPAYHMAFSAYFAFQACEQVLNNNTKKDALWAEYEQLIATAMNIDAMQDAPSVNEIDPWTESRLIYGTSYTGL